MSTAARAPRVAIVTNMPSGYQSELFSALDQRPECDIHVLFLRQMTPGRQWTRLPDTNYPHTFVRELRIHPYFYLNSGLFKALRAVRPDLIIVGQYAGIGMQLVMYYASMFGIPWVFWSERPGVEHTELPIFQSDWLRRFFRGIALFPVLRWPREIWGIGSRATAHYAENSRIPCRSVPYYSDLSRFLALQRETQTGPLRFLCSGKLNIRKGVDLALTALRRLLKEEVDFRWTFMGDGPLRDEVVALATEHSDRVQYLGFKELDEIPEVLRSHDVQVCASRYDGWGMVIPEGMAAGLAVLSTRGAGSALDLIQEDANGFLVEPGSADALYEGVSRMIAQPERVTRFAKAGRQSVKAFHNVAGAEHFAACAVSAYQRGRG